MAVLTACGRPHGEAPPAEGAMRLSFEDRPEPAAFAREGPAVRDGPEGSAGLWAAVRGLPRPERAVVENPANGTEVVVALFAASAGPGIRLSNEAADALNITGGATVRITALRRELQIDTTTGRF
jgi:hypothetical protein